MTRRDLRSPLLEDIRLFQDAVSAGRLLAAWSRVRANAGASGGDGVTIRAFEGGLERRLISLSDDLRSGRYRPGPLRVVDIPKAAGGLRRLRIPPVADRVVQTAIHMTLGPPLEEEFEEASFGYRPGRGVRDAVAAVDAFRAEGYGWVVDADIDDFFDSVDHDLLMDRLAQSMKTGPLTSLIALSIGMASPTGRGLAQGSPLSPLLANLYLDRIDERLRGRGVRIVRYADDFVVLAKGRGKADDALKLAERSLREAGLRLDPDKTRVTSFDQGFRFLGHLFIRSLVLKSGVAGHGLAGSDEILRRLGRAEAEVEDDAAREEREAESRAAAGLAAAFSVLYVRGKDRRVVLRDSGFRVVELSGPEGAGPVRELIALPHQQINRIEIYPGAEIASDALRHAAAHGITVCHVNGHGETLGVTGSALAVHAGRQLAQARCVLDPDARLDLARRIVDGRLRNQRAALRRWNRKRSDPDVVKAIEAINQGLRALRGADSVAAAMGHEGRAAALYWPAFAKCLENGFDLPRRRDGPPNPTQILLNFASHLLARDVAVALTSAGLHPGFGVLHQGRDGYDAAVFDLMEEFRAPLCESVILSAINSGAVGRGNFAALGDGTLRLDREGGDALIRAYERQAGRVVRHPVSKRRGSWRAIMTEQAFALAAHFDDDKPYQPHVIDY